MERIKEEQIRIAIGYWLADGKRIYLFDDAN